MGPTRRTHDVQGSPAKALMAAKLAHRTDGVRRTAVASEDLLLGGKPTTTIPVLGRRL